MVRYAFLAVALFAGCGLLGDSGNVVNPTPIPAPSPSAQSVVISPLGELLPGAQAIADAGRYDSGVYVVYNSDGPKAFVEVRKEDPGPAPAPPVPVPPPGPTPGPQSVEAKAVDAAFRRYESSLATAWQEAAAAKPGTMQELSDLALPKTTAAYKQFHADIGNVLRPLGTGKLDSAAVDRIISEMARGARR